MHKVTSFFLLFYFAVKCSCGIAQSTTDDIIHQPFFGLKGDSVPAILLPDIVSTGSMETNGTFSPDGREFFYSTEFLHVGATIIFMKLENGQWSLPEIAPFSGRYRDIDPIFSPDGKRIYFTSRRPLHDSLAHQNDTNIWYVEKNSQGYSEPVQVGVDINTAENQFYNSISKKKTLFFHAKNEATSNDLFKARWKEGKYVVEPLDSAINSKYSDADPFVAQDESFVLFSSDRPGGLGGTDLYISFAQDSSWTVPLNLGAPINSIANDYAPNLNGEIMTFTSGRFIEPWSEKDKNSYQIMMSKIHGPDNGLNNILWVSSAFLESMRNRAAAANEKQ